MRVLPAAVLALVLTVAPAFLRAQKLPPPPAAMREPHARVTPGTLLAAPERTSHRRVWVATLTGAGAGAVLGSLAIPTSGLAPGQVGAHRLRAGVTYGLMGGVLSAALALRGTPAADARHSFWRDRVNTPLLMGMATTQILDYASTRYFRNRGMDEWLLTNKLVDNRPAFIATEITAFASATALAWIFHHTGHHRLERIFEAGYITMGATSAVANFRYPTVGHALF